MDSLLCNLFAIPLGAALLALIAWPFLRRWFDRKLLQFSHVGILWLNEECRERLKNCAKPSKLRFMELATIEKYIDRIPFANSTERPTSLQIATWPIQARLICDGNFVELRERQAGWIACPEFQSENAGLDFLDIEQASPPFPSKADFYWLVALSGLLATSIAIYLASQFLGCSTTVCKNCKDNETKVADGSGPGVTAPGGTVAITENGNLLDLRTDQLFEYKSDTLLPAQRRRAVKVIDELLSQFNNVEITGIEGFTDPIGTLCSNAELAKGRAKEIQKLLVDTGKVSINPNLEPIGLGPSSEPDDIQTWRYCRDVAADINKTYGGFPAFEQSKKDCVANPQLREKYPDAILTPANPYKLSSVTDAVRMSEAQQTLKSCVSTMRRVTISFSGTPKSKSIPQVEGEKQ